MEVLGTAVTAVVVGLLLAGAVKYGIKREVRKQLGVELATVAILDSPEYAMICTCGHLSNMHREDGVCNDRMETQGRYTGDCRCRRYQGPMGLTEMELWGPQALKRTPAPEPVAGTELLLPVTHDPRPTGYYVGGREPGYRFIPARELDDE